MRRCLEWLAAQALRLALRTLPAPLRSGIEADLHESTPTAPGSPPARQLLRMTGQVLGIAWHYQIECHRSHEARLQFSALLAACAALLLLLPPALHTLALGWSSLGATARLADANPGLLTACGPALAAGLLLGRCASGPPHLTGSRSQATAALLLMSFAQHEFLHALASTAALVLGLWLGEVRQQDQAPERSA